MKRILLMVFRNLWFVPWAWCKLCYRASHTDKYTEEEQYSFIRWVDLHANKGGNVKIDVHGSENIPAENGFMFFPNHQGLYDVLAMIEACPQPFSVVAKKEVGNIPFLKQVFSCLKAFLLDREDVRQAMKVIIDVSKEVEKGRNYLIFPEGTRNKERQWQLAEFKNGAALIALRNDAPILPVCIVEKPRLFHRTKVVIGEAICLADWMDDTLSRSKNIRRISTRLRDTILNLRATANDRERPS